LVLLAQLGSQRVEPIAATRGDDDVMASRRELSRELGS
jgi:hypothetical protein